MKEEELISAIHTYEYTVHVGVNVVSFSKAPLTLPLLPWRPATLT